MIKNWLRSIRYAIRRAAWPVYECELCVGQDPWQGCYCAYYKSDRPGGPDLPLWRRLLRRVVRER